MLAGWTDVFCLLSGVSSKFAVRVASRDGTEPIRREGTHTLTEVRGSNVGLRVDTVFSVTEGDCLNSTSIRS